jgi:hypothetical protein
MVNETEMPHPDTLQQPLTKKKSNRSWISFFILLNVLLTVLCIVLIVLIVVTPWGTYTYIPCSLPESTNFERRPPDRSHPETMPGQVTVKLSKPSFHQGECVQVTVANGLDHPATTYMGVSINNSCIVKLERLGLFGWSQVSFCVPIREPRGVEIAPGEVVEVGLDPYTSFYTKPAFGVGIYRAVFNSVTSPAFVVLP